MRTLITSLLLGVSIAGLQAPSAGALGPPPRPYIRDQSTALLYHLDEDVAGTARDAGARHRHGAMHGALMDSIPRFNCEGGSYFGRALSTSQGRGYVAWVDRGAGSESWLLPVEGAAITIEGWFQLKELGASDSHTLFAVQPAETSRVLDFALRIAPPGADDSPDSARTLQFLDASGVRAETTPLRWYSGQWVHVALVMQRIRGAVEVKVYRSADYEVKALEVLATTLRDIRYATSTADRVLSFARRYASWRDDGFRGVIDELRVSTRARAPDELELTLGPDVYAQIRQAAVAENDEADHPLPLASTWDTGIQRVEPQPDDGYTPGWQLSKIAQGHHLLPALWLPWVELDPESSREKLRFERYYEPALRTCAKHALPLSFPGTQWEQLLAVDPRYLSLPIDRNPNVLSGGQPVSELSPFGDVEAWRALGARWGSSAALRKLQNWYPKPPKVIFISNNEATRLTWTNAGRDRRFDALVARKGGERPSDDEIRRLFGDGWVKRYRAMQRAWRGALASNGSSNWAEVSSFAGYNAWGMSQMGRWWGWSYYGLFSGGRVDPNPLMWDGAMLDGYLMPGIAEPVGSAHYPTDYWVYSPQVDYMNDEFFRRHALRNNPHFWVELGVWNGDDNYPPREKKLRSFTPPYSPSRYAGMVQFGMWMLRPRVVRDFRGNGQRRSSEPYVNAVIAAVDRVYEHPILSSFWRSSELVPNRAQAHPYAALLPPEAASADRMFMLEVASNPKPPWDAFTEIAVFALARVQGEWPNRKFLIYAHAPRAGNAAEMVQVTVPAPTSIDPRSILQCRVRASAGGTFSLLDEHSGLVTTL